MILPSKFNEMLHEEEAKRKAKRAKVLATRNAKAIRQPPVKFLDYLLNNPEFKLPSNADGLIREYLINWHGPRK